MADLTLNISQYSPLQQFTVRPWETFSPDDQLAITDKINLIVQTLNRLGKLSNDVVTDWNKVMTWVSNDGMTAEVDSQLQKWKDDGTLTALINAYTGIGDLTTLQTVAKDTLVNAINENVAHMSDMTTKQGDLTQLNTTDKSSIVNALKEVKSQANTNQTQIFSLSNGSPIPVSLVVNMTDHTRNYVYTGSESGYTAGNWYYWNGTAWVSGGVYQSSGIADNSVKPKQTTFLNRSSKNLLGLSDVSNVNLPGGITYSVSSGVITLNGTASANVDITLPIEATITASSSLPVMFSIVTNATSTQIMIGTNAAATNNLPWGAAPAGNSRVINTSITISSMVLRVLSGASFSNMTIKCQIENGSVLTQYQSYYVYQQNTDLLNRFFYKIRSIDPTRMGYVSDGSNTTVGSINSDTNWGYRKIILKHGEKITFTVSTVKGALPLTKCNSDWSFNSAILSVTNTGYVTNTYDYIATDDTEYLIVSHASVNAPLILYKYKISDDEIRNNGLYGKKIAFIGDSYVANNVEPVEKTWHYKLADKYNMTYINKGINGDGLIGVRNSLTPVKDRILTDVDTTVDYLILIGGENDYNISLPITDFNAGLDTLIGQYLQGVYAENGVKVGVFVPWRRGNSGLDNYINALVTKCNQYGIPVFDSVNAGLYPSSTNYSSVYYQTSTDTSHLNERGHNYFYKKAEKFMLGL